MQSILARFKTKVGQFFKVSSAVQQYVRSPSTRLGFTVGFIMYVAYAIAGHNYNNIGLIALSFCIALLLPSYSRFTNKVEEFAALRTASVTLARCARFVPQLKTGLRM